MQCRLNLLRRHKSGIEVPSLKLRGHVSLSAVGAAALTEFLEDEFLPSVLQKRL